MDTQKEKVLVKILTGIITLVSQIGEAQGITADLLLANVRTITGPDQMRLQAIVHRNEDDLRQLKEAAKILRDAVS